MSRLIAALACLLLVVGQSATTAPRSKPDLWWAAVLILLLIAAYRGRALAWVLVTAVLSAFALVLVLANLTDPGVLVTRGLPAVAAAVLAYSLWPSKRRRKLPAAPS